MSPTSTLYSHAAFRVMCMIHSHFSANRRSQMPVTPCRPRWKGTMTDRQRFNNQMHYKPVDRCFNMEFGYWEENYTQWDLFVKNGIKNEGDANVFFNFDRLGGVGGNLDICPPFEHKIVAETATTVIVHERRRPAGRVAQGRPQLDPALHQGLHRHARGLETRQGRAVQSGRLLPQDRHRAGQEGKPAGPRLRRRRQLRFHDRPRPRHAQFRGPGLRGLRLSRHG